MKILVVYDSVFDNTAMVARAIASALSGDVQHVRDAAPVDVSGLDLLVVGSPTRGGRPTPAIEAYLKAIPNRALSRVRVAAFDTRFAAGERGVLLRTLMRIIGYAAPKIAKRLHAKGGTLVAPPEGFIVDGKEGPLRSQELERATAWLKELVAIAPAHVG